MRRIVFLAGMALALSACGGGQAEETSTLEQEPLEREPVRVDVMVASTSGSIGRNHDDVYCLWKDTEYVLRDGKGETVAIGNAESWNSIDGDIGGESTEVGQVESEDPYRCEMQFSIDDVPAVKFYELTVTTRGSPRDEKFIETVNFRLDDVEPANPIEVEFAG